MPWKHCPHILPRSHHNQVHSQVFPAQPDVDVPLLEPAHPRLRVPSAPSLPPTRSPGRPGRPGQGLGEHGGACCGCDCRVCFFPVKGLRGASSTHWTPEDSLASAWEPEVKSFPSAQQKRHHQGLRVRLRGTKRPCQPWAVTSRASQKTGITICLHQPTLGFHFWRLLIILNNQH